MNYTLGQQAYYIPGYPYPVYALQPVPQAVVVNAPRPSNAQPNNAQPAAHPPLPSVVNVQTPQTQTQARPLRIGFPDQAGNVGPPPVHVVNLTRNAQPAQAANPQPTPAPAANVTPNPQPAPAPVVNVTPNAQHALVVNAQPVQAVNVNPNANANANATPAPVTASAAPPRTRLVYLTNNPTNNVPPARRAFQERQRLAAQSQYEAFARHYPNFGQNDPWAYVTDNFKTKYSIGPCGKCLKTNVDNDCPTLNGLHVCQPCYNAR